MIPEAHVFIHLYEGCVWSIHNTKSNHNKLKKNKKNKRTRETLLYIYVQYPCTHVQELNDRKQHGNMHNALKAPIKLLLY